jgi:hypothetical protein
MTKLLDQGIQAVRLLPAERQDVAGEVLLAIAGQRRAGYSLSAEQIEDIKLALAEADRGEFAADAEMSALWRKCGL